jgi:hypothetical protein
MMVVVLVCGMLGSLMFGGMNVGFLVSLRRIVSPSFPGVLGLGGFLFRYVGVLVG